MSAPKSTISVNTKYRTPNSSSGRITDHTGPSTELKYAIRYFVRAISQARLQSLRQLPENAAGATDPAVSTAAIRPARTSRRERFRWRPGRGTPCPSAPAAGAVRR